MNRIIIFLFYFFCLQATWGQSPLDTRLDFSVQGSSISAAISQLAEESGVSISFSNNFFPSKQNIKLEFHQKTVAEILQKILAGSGVEYMLIGNQIILRRRAKPRRKYTISGYIQNANDGEKLIAATIFSPEHQKGTISNEYGFFSLSLPEGPTAIVCSYLGSEEKKLDILLDKNHPIKVELRRFITLGEIEVRPVKESGQQLFSTSTNASEVAIKQLERIPDLGGEPDLLRAAQLLPGVQSGADGLGGLHIRGGNADQNLMLLDGVPIYNSSHLLGIFSVFNTSAIRGAKLIKGNFPARYGGRLSSILDVRSREGNEKKWSGEVQSGLVSAKATLEGPLSKKGGAFLLSGRRTHSTFLLDQVIQNAFFPGYMGPLKYYFYDLNAKVNFSLNSRDRIYLGFYNGGDQFKTSQDLNTSRGDTIAYDLFETSLRWGNLVGSLRWNHQFGNKLFANTTVTYSRYRYSNSQLNEFFEEESGGNVLSDEYQFVSTESDIRDLAAKVDFDLVSSPTHYWRFGIGLTMHSLAPGVGYFEGSESEFNLASDSISIDKLDDFFDFSLTQSREWNAYIEDEFSVKDKWIINVGLRLSGLIHPEASYFNPEPRLGLRYAINDQWSVHGGISRMVQYLHRLTGIGISKPDDVWISSSGIIRPQNSWQGGLSIRYSTPQKLDISLESYLKSMNNLVRFDDETSFLDPAEDIEENLVFGNGIAAGLELLVKKDFGKTGGHFAYTFAKSKRWYPEINQGNEFSFLFDRRHQFSLFLFHRFNKKLEFSASFLYGSSHPLVAIEDDLDLGLKALPIDPQGEKNQSRNEGYHRLDISFLYKLHKPRFQHTCKIGLYNAYNQRNEAFRRLSYEEEEGAILEPVSFMPLLPSLSYSLKF